MVNQSVIARIASVCLVSLMVSGRILANDVDLHDVNATAAGVDRQLTVMAIQAMKGEGTFDPKLANVESRLAVLLPDHGFSLLDGRSRPVKKNESFTMVLKNGMKLRIQLIEPEDSEGKVHVEVRLENETNVLLNSTIRTPPNQLFFLDHKISEREHLLIAVGAR